jgi:hypothetical protein
MRNSKKKNGEQYSSLVFSPIMEFIPLTFEPFRFLETVNAHVRKYEKIKWILPFIAGFFVYLTMY